MKFTTANPDTWAILKYNDWMTAVEVLVFIEDEECGEICPGYWNGDGIGIPKHDTCWPMWIGSGRHTAIDRLRAFGENAQYVRDDDELWENPSNRKPLTSNG